MARRHIPQGNWSDSDAPQLEDRMADGIPYLADHTVFSFIDDHTIPPVVFCVPYKTDASDLVAFPFNLYAAHSARNIFPGEPALELDEVFLVDAVPGVHYPIGEVAVIREKDEPFGAVVEASHGKETCAACDEIPRYPPVHRVFEVADIAGRLVKSDVFAMAWKRYLFAIDCYNVFVSIYSKEWFYYPNIINRYVSCRDKIIGFAAGRYAGMGKEGGESLYRHR